MAKIKPTGFTPQNQHPGWVQDPSGQWHPVAPAPGKAATSPWTVVGWIVLVVLLVPCILGGMVAGITLLGKSASDKYPITTTTTRVR